MTAIYNCLRPPTLRCGGPAIATGTRVFGTALQIRSRQVLLIVKSQRGLQEPECGGYMSGTAGVWGVGPVVGQRYSLHTESTRWDRSQESAGRLSSERTSHDATLHRALG
uniref:Uncharacterized protein n=1 Tax=Knipowitschia caucasica TaxID=637954 RepID=A0AAV2JST0_KNICA